MFLSQVILIFSIIQFKPARYEDYVFPPWAQGVGWVIALASIIWIPLGAIHTLWVLPGSFRQVTYINLFLLFPPPVIVGSTHVYLLLCHTCVNIKPCVNITGPFLWQKLKLSIKPYALDEKSNMAYYERGGKNRGPDIAAISSSIDLAVNPPVEAKFWYLCALHSHNVPRAIQSGRGLVS